MTENELRLMVRAAVARHMSVPASDTSRPVPRSASRPTSHAMFTGLVNVTQMCVIEPDVSCDHCGYCKSQGY